MLKKSYIEFLVASGQLDFYQRYPIPQIVLEAQKSDPRGGVEKPPFKLRTALENGEELSRMDEFITNWMAMEGIKIPNYIGGPSNKAIPLCVTTAMELLKYNHNGDIGFLFDRKGEPHADTAQLLKAGGVKIVRDDNMKKGLTAGRVMKFARERAEWVRDTKKYPEFVDAVAGDGMGIAGATAVLKTLYDEYPKDSSANKTLLYGQMSDGSPTIKGDIKRGDIAFLIRYPHADTKGFYGDVENADELLLLDDSAVSCRSLINYMKKLRKANPEVKIRHIMVPIVIEELEWMREEFKDYIDREWDGSTGNNVKLHVLTTSKEIIEYVHRAHLSVGGKDLVDIEAYEKAQKYFERMEGLGRKSGYTGKLF